MCIVTITWSLLFVVIALWVIYLTQEITLAPRCSSGLPTLVCFLIFHQLTRKHLALLVDMVSGFKSFSEAPHLARKVVPAGVTVLLGFFNPPRRGCGEPAKPRLLYPLVWIPCCDIVN
jgi:prepilin signal peptidase PulO-like enzyme (type II secretory pathway)